MKIADNQKIYHNNIIPGLMTMGTEFLAVEQNVLRVFHNHKEIAFEELPEYVFKTIRKTMKQLNATMGEMKDFAFGRWGGMDGKVDITEDGIPSEPEYMPNFTSAYFDNGAPIGDGPMRVLEYIYLKDKEIADRLCISPKTVAGHCAYLFFNTGFNGRAEVTVWAKEKGFLKRAA
jgi:hypothetical protein